MDRRRTAVARVGLVLAGLAVGFGLIELGLRGAGYDPLGELVRSRTHSLRPTDAPFVLYEPQPGWSGHSWGTDVTFDSRGLRGPEVTDVVPEHRQRATILGDSVAFGQTVEDQWSVRGRLQARLQEGGPLAEVLNLAVPGYDTVQAVARLDALVPELEPGRVVLLHCVNDLGIQSAGLATIRLLDRLGPLVGASRLLQLLVVRFDRADVTRDMTELNTEPRYAEHFADSILPVDDDAELAALVSELQHELAAHPVPEDAPYPAWYVAPARLGHLRFGLSWLAELSRDHDLDTTVAIVPYLDPGPLAEAHALTRRIVAHEARRAGLDVVDLTPALEVDGLATFADHGPDWWDPLHPNAAGHDRMAEAIVAHWRGDGG